jgi:hypothetical protein
MIKKYKWFAIGGLLVVLCVGYVVCDRPSLMDKINYWRGQYDEQKKVAMADAQIKLATIAELEGQNALLQSSIDSANTIIVGLEEDVADAEAEVADARKGWDKFSVECQAKLKELDLSWSSVHEIDRKEMGELKGQVFSLTKQYQNEIKVSAEYRNLWQSEKGLRLKAEDGLGLFDKKVASLQRKVKTTQLVAVAVVLAVVLLKK